MFIAYLDESARNDDFYFMGTVVVDDEAIVAIETSLDHIGEMISADVPGFDASTEFHGYEMFHGEGAWKNVPLGWRVKACKLLSKTLVNSGARYLLRGIDVNAQKARYRNPFAPHNVCTAHTFETIEMILAKDNHAESMALVVADEHHSAPDSRRNLRNFKASSVFGYTSRQCERIADTIYFGPSHSSRLLQLSDVATYFVNRHETQIETDPRSQAAVDHIWANVMLACRFYYVWSPN
ncbi:DUF3800 domain-containing protein [Subtercola lobariae]|uniref:DUF3800 domain-containing protein n=1 Tax=Subtercola lobariae TaxID=1588641 RepID=A0A917F1R0_9MICO|nr:DUF3800 domain-containing protein [Subtercola lobariae]GGF39760.1 hypothetical protein GCM10011399_35820 [Subtercola lobariae]